jgi:hypothetical protein
VTCQVPIPICGISFPVLSFIFGTTGFRNEIYNSLNFDKLLIFFFSWDAFDVSVITEL